MKRKSKLKIAIFTHNYPLNSNDRKDAGIFIHDFAHELSKQVDVFILSPDFGGRKEKNNRVKVSWFKWGGPGVKFGTWKLYNPMSVYNFFRLIYFGSKYAIEFVKTNNIDYILSCWAVPSAIFAYRVNKISGIPYGIWSLGSDVNKYSKIPVLNYFIKRSLLHADNLFCNSFLLSDKIYELVKRKSVFLPAITSFDSKETYEPKTNNKVFNFLFVGRLEKIKGVDVLLEAIFLMNSQEKFVLNILGSGSMEESLKKRAELLTHKVNFFGWANESAVKAYMRESDVLIIPSRSESLPLVMIEAAKSKLLVIATDVGDCKRMIKKYNIGACVQKENPRVLARAMDLAIGKKLIKKKPLFKNLVADYSQEKAVDLFLSNIMKI